MLILKHAGGRVTIWMILLKQEQIVFHGEFLKYIFLNCWLNSDQKHK